MNALAHNFLVCTLSHDPAQQDADIITEGQPWQFASIEAVRGQEALAARLCALEAAGQPFVVLHPYSLAKVTQVAAAALGLVEPQQAKQDAGQPLDGIRTGQPAHWRH